MSVIASDTVIRPRRAGSKARIWPRFARVLRRFDRGERYSPVLCIAALLMTGLMVKTVPAIQTFLAHN